MEEVLDVSAQWYHLGLQLKVRIGILDSIQTQFPDPKRQLLEVLKTWLTTSGNTCWNTLTDALKSRSVGASQLASVLETKYGLVKVENDASTWFETNIINPVRVSEQVVPIQQPGVVHMQESK